ncbi:MAG: hypothetical protein IAE79_17550 [Anaerolinea sp.]|nr:hypothetical protein [Anaerolinea sp.]
MLKPTKVNILGVTYTVEYVQNPAEVDIFRRKSLWGQIDYWTRTIRIYDNGRPMEDLWQTLLHEILHGIAEAMHLNGLNEHHEELDIVALALTDVLFRNGWLTGGDSGD